MTETNLTNVVNHDDGGSPSYGVCQVKLNTARMFDDLATEESLLNPHYNIRIAAEYLLWQSRRYKARECVIAAYNAGRCKINEKGILNRSYVRKVKLAMQDYAKGPKRIKRIRKRCSTSPTASEAHRRAPFDAHPPIGFRDLFSQKRNSYKLYSGGDQ